jgi:hypothetical protein
MDVRESSDVTATWGRRLLCSGVIAEEEPESNAKTTSLRPSLIPNQPTAILRWHGASLSPVGPEHCFPCYRDDSAVPLGPAEWVPQH